MGCEHSAGMELLIGHRSPLECECGDQHIEKHELDWRPLLILGQLLIPVFQETWPEPKDEAEIQNSAITVLEHQYRWSNELADAWISAISVMTISRGH